MEINSINNKIIVILGPTASGKTSLGVKLAHKFNGEIISADSRQVYKGMDVGTGKDLKEYNFKITNYKLSPLRRDPALNKYNKVAGQITNKIQNLKSKKSKSRFIKIPYHLINVVSPKTEFNLAKYQKLALKAIDDVLRRGKTPIIVGGTGLYLQALIDGYALSEVKPDKALRARLEKKTVEQLFAMLEKIDSDFAKTVNESDRKNKRRLIRYLEIKGSKSPRGLLEPLRKYDFLLIGLTWPKEVLEKRIYKRLIERLEKEDMIGEVERLHKQSVSWKRLESFGLEYKFISLHLQGKLEYDEMVERLFIAIRQFAKKQMTWFRRWERQGRKIEWVKDSKETRKLVSEFLNKK